MSDPQRLIEQATPVAHLLRSAELDVPSEGSRRRALAAAAGALVTLGASGTSAASAASALTVKTLATWLCVGALAGAVTAGVAAGISRPSAPHGDLRGAPTRPGAAGPGKLAPPRRGPGPELTATALPPSEAAPVPKELTPAARPSALNPTPELPFPAPPSPAPSVAAFSEESAGLFAELRFIESARNALGRGELSSVLATLDRYQAAYPSGHFGPEASVLRIEALYRSGDTTRARALAARLEHDYPKHPLLRRVHELLDTR